MKKLIKLSIGMIISRNKACLFDFQVYFSYVLILAIYLLLGCTSLFATPKVIGIAGGSGAGKTTMVKAIQAQLGDRAVIISMDNYFRDLSHLSFEERKKTNFDDPAAFDLALLCEHILQLKNGQTVDQPRYDFTTKTRSSESIPTNSTDTILVDGFLLLAVPEICDLCDLKLFIDVEEAERLFRIIDRDQFERVSSFEEIKERYINFVAPCYEKYIRHSKYQADLIIPNGLDNHRSFQLLLELIKIIHEHPLL